jgi:hypothetical protein
MGGCFKLRLSNQRIWIIGGETTNLYCCALRICARARPPAPAKERGPFDVQPPSFAKEGIACKRFLNLDRSVVREDSRANTSSSGFTRRYVAGEPPAGVVCGKNNRHGRAEARYRYESAVMVSDDLTAATRPGLLSFDRVSSRSQDRTPWRAARASYRDRSNGDAASDFSRPVYPRHRSRIGQQIHERLMDTTGYTTNRANRA